MNENTKCLLNNLILKSEDFLFLSLSQQFVYLKMYGVERIDSLKSLSMSENFVSSVVGRW